MFETTIFNMLAVKSRKIDFNPEWASLYKYATGGINAPILHEGEIVSGEDPQGRRFVIICNNINNNIIFFERYKSPDHKYIIDVRMTKLNEHAFTVIHDINLDGLISNDTVKKVCEIIKKSIVSRGKIVSSSFVRDNGSDFENTYLFDFL